MSIPRAVSWTTYLRRRTTTGKWLPEIDGLRFIAIAAVLLFHLQGQLEHHYRLDIRPPFTWLARAVGFGNRGVPLFFVLSGFILSLPFARSYASGVSRPSLRRYYLRRVTRLEPPYLLNLALVAVGAALLDHRSWRELWPHLLASAGYLHYAVFHTPSTINSVAWSLEVEVQFYLVAPLLTRVFAVRSASARRALLVTAMIASAALQIAFGLSKFTLAGDIGYFLAGLLLAELYLTRPNAGTIAPLRRFSWDIAALAGWPAFFLLPERLTPLWLPALALLLCLGGLRGAIASRILRTPVMAITGGMCYSIYLWHAPVLTVVDRMLQHIPALAQASYPEIFLIECAIKSAAVIAVCLPLFLAIERPCMDPDWPAKLAARLRGARASTPLVAADS
jgi:peptidoglycan/LPS O-acetylase OafA/YrhL